MGFLCKQFEIIPKKRSIMPYGLVFLTGPTGSGKSLLYAILNEIKSTDEEYRYR